MVQWSSYAFLNRGRLMEMLSAIEGVLQVSLSLSGLAGTRLANSTQTRAVDRYTRSVKRHMHACQHKNRPCIAAVWVRRPSLAGTSESNYSLPYSLMPETAIMRSFPILTLQCSCIDGNIGAGSCGPTKRRSSSHLGCSSSTETHQPHR